MRTYEIMVIVDPEVDDRQVQPLIERYLKTITDGGGSVEGSDFWGKRRLAYEINKKSEGNYAVLKVNAEPAVVKEMDRLMTIDEQIMRTKVLRADA